MVKQVTRYEASDGTLHATESAAVCAEIAIILGKIGQGEGLTQGIASTIVEKRVEIMAALGQLPAVKLVKADAA